MKSKRMIKQSTLSAIILAIFFFIAVMLIWSILYMNSCIRAEQNAERRRTEFKQLGIDLADASDYLTDEARKFAVTRKIVHLERYWEEINVTRTRDKVISSFRNWILPKRSWNCWQKPKSIPMLWWRPKEDPCVWFWRRWEWMSPTWFRRLLPSS